MGNVKSAVKRNRQRIRRRARNLTVLTKVRTHVKKARALLTEKTAKTPKTAEAVKAAIREIDMAAQKGILKKETASRKISRLAKTLAAAK